LDHEKRERHEREAVAGRRLVGCQESGVRRPPVKRSRLVCAIVDSRPRVGRE